MLGSSGKKILLSIHIILVSTWIGSLIAILLLIFSKDRAFNIMQFDVVDKAIFLLFDSIIMNISIAVAISGLLFSMFTNWGFFRFHWITTKWVTIIVLAIICIFFTSPSINGAAALSDVLRQDVQNHAEYPIFSKQNILYIMMQLFLLTFILFISVIKPWGQRKPKKQINRKIVLSVGFIIAIALTGSIFIQYMQLVHYRNLPVNEIDLSNLDDGYYVGTANYAFEYQVELHIENDSLKDIKFLKNRDNFYARLAEGIRHKIIREQKINIGAVTGATTTSRIFLKACENAMDPNRNK